jgi:hypothetical protein
MFLGLNSLLNLQQKLQTSAISFYKRHVNTVLSFSKVSSIFISDRFPGVLTPFVINTVSSIINLPGYWCHFQRSTDSSLFLSNMCIYIYMYLHIYIHTYISGLISGLHSVLLGYSYTNTTVSVLQLYLNAIK